MANKVFTLKLIQDSWDSVVRPDTTDDSWQMTAFMHLTGEYAVTRHFKGEVEFKAKLHGWKVEYKKETK